MHSRERRHFPMSIAAVRDYLTPFGLADKILEFSTSSATVELAAQAAGVIPARIAKSPLRWRMGRLIIAAGDAKVDNPQVQSRLPHQGQKCSPRERTWWATPSAGCAPSPSRTPPMCTWTSPCSGLTPSSPQRARPTAPWNSPVTSWPSAPRIRGWGTLQRLAGESLSFPFCWHGKPVPALFYPHVKAFWQTNPPSRGTLEGKRRRSHGDRQKTQAGPDPSRPHPGAGSGEDPGLPPDRVQLGDRSFSKLKIPHQSHADFCSTDTAGGLDNKKRRYAPWRGVPPFFLVGFQRGNAPIYTRLQRAGVVC